MKRQAEGNPLAAGLIAFGVGWLVASLLPSSSKEQAAASAIKDQSAPLLEGAKGLVTEAAQSLREPAQDAVQAVKERAGEAASSLKEEGVSEAQSLKGDATDAAQSVQEQRNQ